MRTNKRFLPLLLAALTLASVGQAADRARGGNRGEAPRSGQGQRATSVRAILIVASNEPARADPKLEAYESTLQRVLRFRSFRFVAESSTTVPAGGRASLSVQGHRVELESREDGSVTASRDGNTLALNPATVFVAGSAGANGEVYGLIVMAR